VQVFKKMWRLRKENWLLSSKKKKVNTKFIYLDDAGNDKLPRWLVNVDKKIVCLQCRLSWEILTVVMTSYYKNICLCKKHTVVRRGFCFWQFTMLFLCLMTCYHESWYCYIWTVIIIMSHISLTVLHSNSYPGMGKFLHPFVAGIVEGLISIAALH